MSITELRAITGQRVTGDPSFDGSASAYSQATPDQQIAITNEMKAYIRANPSEFGAAQNQTANTPDIALTENYTVSDQLSDFSDELGNQALRVGKSVGSIGNGLLNTLNLAKWGLPIVAITVVGILIYGFYKKETK